jgi:hypothetical protein
MELQLSIDTIKINNLYSNRIKYYKFLLELMKGAILYENRISEWSRIPIYESQGYYVANNHRIDPSRKTSILSSR